MSLPSLGRLPMQHGTAPLLLLVLGCSSGPGVLFESSGGASGLNGNAGSAASQVASGGGGGVEVAGSGGMGGGSAGASASDGGTGSGGESAGAGGLVASAQGGAPSAAGPCQAPHILDDAEDHNGAICRVDGHVGNWWTTNDGTNGNQQPKPGSTVTPQRVTDRPGSSLAMHTSGNGFTAWGATLGFDVRTAPDLPYDASAFAALTFYAKGPVNGSIRVSIRVSGVTPTMYGGTCVESSGSCYHYHGVEFTISDTWEPYRIPFADLVRENDWDGAFDPARVVGVEFRINNPACTKDFSLWIDDVAFEPP